MDLEAWAHDVDVNTPSSARMYDYYLGGSHNFTADRLAAAKVVAALPEAPQIARANRAYLGRAVRYMLAQGVRQFVDLGSGIPTVGNVHEIAQRVAPDSRVVYADVDPVAVTLSQRLLEHNERAVAVRCDLTRPRDVLNHPDVRGLLDLGKPVGLLLVSVLHFVPDAADPWGVIAWLRDRFARGSHLALSHGVPAVVEQDVATLVREVYRATTTSGGVRSRTREQILTFFDGFDLVEPGLVPLDEWHPDDPTPGAFCAGARSIVAGVGRLG